jgi:hypothetical protein
MAYKADRSLAVGVSVSNEGPGLCVVSGVRILVLEGLHLLDCVLCNEG